MTSGPFASLHAGLLARKGAAKPSVEAPYLAIRRPPAAGPGPVHAMDAGERSEPSLPVPYRNDSHAASPGAEPFGAPPTLQTPLSLPPAAMAAVASSTPSVARHAATEHPSPSVRAHVRLTRQQARALRLAALVLDRPQQELLAEGLEAQLEKLACSDLNHCACFRAIAAALEKD